MNICFDIFGCRLNRAEALDDMARCKAAGHTLVEEHSKADTIVVRGCSVTARAQRDCERLLHHLQKKYPAKRVIVTGCLPGALKLTPALLTHAKGAAEQPYDEQPVPLETARAYLKVQDGCDCKCTFCIVPKFRGKAISVPFATVLERARKFIAAGYHEIVVTGCNLALYLDGGKRLPDLIAALAELDPNCRIRLGSIEPTALAREVVDVMAAHENVCRMLHIPFQSGSDRILAAMGRPYREKDVQNLVMAARKAMPRLGLGCDVMTGFPGETEGDFRRTKTLLTTLGFTNVHVFPYSERPGTPAAENPMQIPHDIKKERARELEHAGKAARARFAKSLVGQNVTVVVESDNHRVGWSGEYLWTQLRCPAKDKPARRTLVSARVMSASSDGSLIATIVTHGR